MPINNSLEPVKLPASLGLNEKINTEFIDHLDVIKVTLTNSPSFDDLCDYLPEFVSATWAEKPFHLQDLSDITYDVKRNFPKLRDSILDAEKSIIDKRYPEWRHLFNELVVNVESVESMIVVLADVMSCIQYANTEINLGNSGYMRNVSRESKKRMRELEKKLKKHRRK